MQGPGLYASPMPKPIPKLAALIKKFRFVSFKYTFADFIIFSNCLIFIYHDFAIQANFASRQVRGQVEARREKETEVDGIR